MTKDAHGQDKHCGRLPQREKGFQRRRTRPILRQDATRNNFSLKVHESSTGVGQKLNASFFLRSSLSRKMKKAFSPLSGIPFLPCV